MSRSRILFSGQLDNANDQVGDDGDDRNEQCYPCDSDSRMFVIVLSLFVDGGVCNPGLVNPQFHLPFLVI